MSSERPFPRGYNGGRKRSMASKDVRRARQYLERAYGNTCCYCGHAHPIEALKVHHHLPRALGGTNAQENLRWACDPCREARNVETNRVVHDELPPVPRSGLPVETCWEAGHLTHKRAGQWVCAECATAEALL